jgi:hypothetical protein
MILLRRWYLLALAVASCGDTDDGGTDPTAAETTSDATTATTTTMSTTDASTTASTTDTSTTTTESTTASTTASTTDVETGDTSATDDTATGTTADTDGVACGDAACGADEVCVLPCCGGPPPGCFDTQKDGTCQDGGDPVPAKECPVPCSTEMCCPPEPCMAEPPHCEPAADLQCHETMCSIGECFGELQDGTVTCSCA